MPGINYQNGHIEALGKGLGRLPDQPLAAGAALGWNLLREDVAFPAAVLCEEIIQHNLRWMQDFVAKYQVRLAPHGKTTMAPKLFARQLAGGAWGITLATAHQTNVAHHHGVRRVLMANQLVGRRNLELISDLLRDPGFEFCCLIDSADGVDILGRFFAERGQVIQVLLELGVAGGRSGVRDEQQQATVIAALERWPQAVRLIGVEVYEGVLKQEAEIRQFLRRAVTVTRELASAGRLKRSPAILTGAGSAWYDVVAEEFGKADVGMPVEIVLRPGCYLTHDVGIYKTAQANIVSRNPIAREMQTSLKPALQLWACVLSVPEPGRAIVGLGKRDSAFDAGLPVPIARFRPGSAGGLQPTPAHWLLTSMMDQHAYLQLQAGDDLRVGDLLVFDISHPCLTFDKWRHLLVVDGAHNVIDVVQTFF